MDFSISEEDRLLRESVWNFVEEKANAVWKQIEHGSGKRLADG